MSDLKSLIVQRGLFNNELARKMGVSRSLVNHIVSGISAPSDRVCELAGEALGVSPETIRELAPAKPRPHQAGEPQPRSRCRRALMLRGITNEDVALKIGMSESYTRRIINGTSAPTDEAIATITKMTGLDRKDLWPEYFGTVDSDVAGGL